MPRRAEVAVLALAGVLACSAAAGPAEEAQVGFAARDERGAASVVANAGPPSPAAKDASAPLAGMQPSQAGAIVSMIIRRGQASIEVDSLETAIARVGQLAAASGGYLANTSIQSGQREQRSASLEIKVPSDRYQGAVDRLAEIGKVVSSNSTAEDVGEEFVDVSARVANGRRLEERLVTLLATRTGKLDDVLTVERELARVREEIERYEGRLRWLRSQTAMSTLTVTVYEPAPLVGSPGQSVIGRAFRDSWRNFVAVVAGGIALAGTLVPVFVFGGLLLLGLRAGWRRFRRAEAGMPATG